MLACPAFACTFNAPNSGHRFLFSACFACQGQKKQIASEWRRPVFEMWTLKRVYAPRTTPFSVQQGLCTLVDSRELREQKRRYFIFYFILHLHFLQQQKTKKVPSSFFVNPSSFTFIFHPFFIVFPFFILHLSFRRHFSAWSDGHHPLRAECATPWSVAQHPSSFIILFETLSNIIPGNKKRNTPSKTKKPSVHKKKNTAKKTKK